MPAGRAYLSTAGPYWRKAGCGSSLQVTPIDGVAAEGEARSSRFSCVALLWIALLLPAVTTAAEAAGDRIVRFDISRQRADKALVEFAEQADVTFIFPADEARKVTANAVRGEFTPQAAIVMLLEGTGLQPRVQADGALTVNAEMNSAEKGDTVKKRGLFAGIVAVLAAITTVDVNADQETETRVIPEKLEDVIVTARKRTETLQDVPLSVSVLQGAELSKLRIESVDNLYGFVPNLFSVTLGQNVASDSVYIMIRGVGFNGGQEPATGVFVDGVYQPQIGYDISFLDLDRLEVMRGPQGTLYGRNTQAGALNLVTKKPGTTLQGKVEAEVAEFGTFRAQASLRGPMAENFFGGISAEYGQSDGYVDNTTSGADRNPYDQFSTRGALRWLPTGAVEVNFSADASQKEFNDIGYGVPLSCRCFEVQEDEVEDEKNLYGASLTVDWDISETLTLTSITGQRSVDSDITLDFDLSGTPTAIGVVSGIPGSVLTPNPLSISGANYRTAFEQDIFSQELRLTGKVGSEFNYQIGAYYFDQSENYKRVWETGPDVATDPGLAFFPPFYAYQDLIQDRDGWAIFGQASWRPFAELEVTLGGRYASETDRLSGESNARLETIDVTILNQFDESLYTDSFESFTGLGSISYDISDDAMGYFTISQGWKSGGFNKLPEEFLSSYDDETSVNYELGLKSAWFANRFLVNLAFFFIDITDQQLSGVVFIDDLPRATITNAGKSESQGFELELTGRLTDRLTLSGALGFTDTEFKQYTDSDGVVRDGESFPFVPELTASATIEYVHPLASGSDLDFAANYVHIGNYTDEDGSFGGPGRIDIPSTDRVDLQVSLLNGGWRFTGYVRNVFDSYDVNNGTFADFYFPTVDHVFVTPLPPRQFGLKVSKEF